MLVEAFAGLSVFVGINLNVHAKPEKLTLSRNTTGI
jgi:hypothetical protein